ncbi:MAG TPA: hypothetical protein VGM23_10500 [Armatimonadota bacterium]|jgi:predicted RNA-binding Zn-ribbon protein involved in translation (DUF1610 family)
MAKRNCPGQDTQYWGPESLFEEPCVHCGAAIEFFKDDLRRICPHCGGYTVNPKNDLACAAWCASAAECLAQMGQRVPDASDDAEVKE